MRGKKNGGVGGAEKLTLILYGLLCVKCVRLIAYLLYDPMVGLPYYYVVHTSLK